MLLLLICFFCFVLFFKSFSSKSLILLSMESEWRLMLSPWIWEDLSSFLASWFKKSNTSTSVAINVPLKMPLSMINLASKEQENAEEEKVSLLDLPDLALECIFERLSPSGLSSMAGVCSSLRDRCTSDHLWETHLNQKWGRIIGDAANREWKWFVASRKKPSLLGDSNQKGILESVSSLWPFSWIKPKFEQRNRPTTSLPVDSFMALYMSLESGKFWFPAQVYNRENGHVGFMLSCYDAQLRYDSRSNSFQARYSPHGRRMIEESIQWDRIRAPPVDTPAYVLHVSDCLNGLKPGDHVEVQWRKSKEFPYGWWYAVIGHVESCDGNERRCRCIYNDTVVLEFNQYSRGSRWRQTMINRKDHREEGNEVDGFYGGVRKLYKEEEIGMWKRLWPNQVFE